jgi:hypothetical protein
MDQVILSGDPLAERFSLARLSCISAALLWRPCSSAGVNTASETTVPGPFAGPSRSRRDAGAGEHHDLRGNRAITMDFIWAKQKSAMGLA